MNRMDISAGALLVLSVIYFFGGIYSLISLLLAIAVHELGHITAIGLLGGSVRKMSFDSSGLCIRYTGIDGLFPELISLISGALLGALFAFAASYFGNATHNTLLLRTAGISILLSMYNMLPALPLDGGRALQCVLAAAFGESCSSAVLEITGVLSGIGLVASGLFFASAGYGMALFIAGIIILIAQTGIVKSFGM